MKRKTCKFYLENQCRRGENCSFSHDLSNDQTNNQSSLSNQPTRNQNRGRERNQQQIVENGGKKKKKKKKSKNIHLKNFLQ